ncbi:MAG TPA: hypothetical protein VJJ77_10955, partial [Dongiaceae bacterium]|nr:hypothetical protein [Dongiaceae bacterium]
MTAMGRRQSESGARPAGGLASLWPRRRRDIFAGSLDALPTAHQIVGSNGAVLYANPACAAMFDAAATPVAAALGAQLAGGAAEAGRLARLAAQAVSGVAGRLELPVRTPGGEIEWRDVTALPLAGRPG